jgi:hypothetical protein
MGSNQDKELSQLLINGSEIIKEDLWKKIKENPICSWHLVVSLKWLKPMMGSDKAYLNHKKYIWTQSIKVQYNSKIILRYLLSKDNLQVKSQQKVLHTFCNHILKLVIT